MLEEKSERNAEWFAEQRQQLQMQLKRASRELNERTILLEEGQFQSKGWRSKSILSLGGDDADDEFDALQKEVDVLKINLKRAEKLADEREQDALLSSEAVADLTEEVE